MFSRRLSPGGAEHSWVQLNFERLVVSQQCQQLVAALLDVTAILYQCCALSWSGEYGLRPVHSMSVTGIATDVFFSGVDHNRSHNYWIPKARPPQPRLLGERAHCYLWLWQWRNAKRWYVWLPALYRSDGLYVSVYVSNLISQQVFQMLCFTARNRITCYAVLCLTSAKPLPLTASPITTSSTLSTASTVCAQLTGTAH